MVISNDVKEMFPSGIIILDFSFSLVPDNVQHNYVKGPS